MTTLYGRAVSLTDVRPARALAAILVAGVVVRVVLAIATKGVAFDLESMAAVRTWLGDGDPLDVYDQATREGQARWPYPPAFFPVLLLVEELAALAFTPETWVRLVFTAGDAVLTWLVFVLLRERTGDDRLALGGAALVALGPSLIAVSGHHGQLDTLTWLPAVGALLVWQRGGARRALYAGLLIGLAASIKTVPIICLFALLPTVRSWREALTVAGAAVAVPAALLLPFFVADLEGVAEALRYRGIVGLGGLSLLVQPELSVQWLTLERLDVSSLNEALQDLNGPLTIVAILAVSALCRRARTPAPRAAVLIVLAVFVFGGNFTVAYASWGVIVLVAAGMLRWAALLQAWLLVPTAIVYLAHPVDGWPEGVVRFVYVPMMAALFAAFVVALARLVRQEASSTPRIVSSEPTPRAANTSSPR